MSDKVAEITNSIETAKGEATKLKDSYDKRGHEFSVKVAKAQEKGKNLGDEDQKEYNKIIESQTKLQVVIDRLNEAVGALEVYQEIEKSTE